MTFQSICLSRIIASLSLGTALMLPLKAHGEEVATPPGKTPPPGDVMNTFDTQRNYLSGKFVDFVSNIDRFFGDDIHYQEANDSVLQIDVDRVMGYGGAHKFVWSGRAKLNMPTAERRLHLLLETDPDRNVVVDPKQTTTPLLKTPDTPESIAAALRFEKVEAERWHLSADAGLRFQGLSSAPFARTRASLAVPLEQWRVRLAETAFWFNTIGAGENTQLDLERPISEPVLFRASSYATWLISTQNFDLRQDFSVFHKLDERTALLYQASALGATRPQTQVTEYVVLALYRYRLHREWFFLELSPQLHFPKALNFRTNAMLSFRLEFLFDKSR